MKPIFSRSDLRRQSREFARFLELFRAAGIPFLTAVVMAGDAQSAVRADELVRQGERPRDVVWRVGSYARFEWAIKNLPRQTFFRLLPELWIASDPDDTKPEYLRLWREAFRRNRNQIVTDGAVLPRGNHTLYRGQIGDANGISWTLDRSIAAKFALSGGGRGTYSGGKIHSQRMDRKRVLAYLTRRNESEVIYDGQAK